MREMKKGLAVLLMIILIMIMASCGGKNDQSPYLGLWKATVATMDNTEIEVSDVLGAFNIDVKANGMATMNASDKEVEAKWEETDKGFKIEDNGEVLEFVAEDDKIFVEQSNIKIYFEKAE